jgi:alkylhydroperoxidase family enzyme
MKANTVNVDVTELAALLASADAGCSYCAEHLAVGMQHLDYNHDWLHLVEAARHSSLADEAQRVMRLRAQSSVDIPAPQ